LVRDRRDIFGAVRGAPLHLLDVGRPALKAALTAARLGFQVGRLVGKEARRRPSNMADILYLGVTVAFFWLSWLLVRLCERL
jgi:hypothetical protein